MPALDPSASRAVMPRAASTTLVLLDGGPGIVVLMVKRSAQASFMPCSFVFPGGAFPIGGAVAPGALRLEELLAAGVGLGTKVSGDGRIRRVPGASGAPLDPADSRSGGDGEKNDGGT